MKWKAIIKRIGAIRYRKYDEAFLSATSHGLKKLKQMKNLKYIPALFLGLSMVFQACKKDAYQFYSGIARIQFGPSQNLLYTSSGTYKDSLKSQTFAYSDISKVVDTVYFDIYTMGDIYSNERAFKLRQELLPGENNAVPGTHYKAFDAPALAGLYTIPAGQNHSRVPVILMRDASLRSKSITLKFRIEENENFKFGQEDLLWRKLVFTDKLSKPATWNIGMLGKYSEVKHRFCISATNQKWDDEFITKIVVDVQAQQYWMGKVKIALLEYNAQHTTPLTDEDNEVVIFP